MGLDGWVVVKLNKHAHSFIGTSAAGEQRPEEGNPHFLRLRNLLKVASVYGVLEMA